MTVTMFNNPEVALKLIRSDNYQDHVRPKYNSKADASSMNIRGKWPKSFGEYAKLWAKTVKGDENAYPSIKEVVMGICTYHMDTVK